MMRPQFARFIAGRHEARQPHAAQHVDVEEARPVGIGDVLERLRLEDAEVVDQDLDAGVGRDQRFGGGRGAQVAGEAEDRAAGRGLDARDRGIDRGLGAAVDDDAGAFGGERRRDRVADAGGAAGDEGQPAGEIEVHVGCSSKEEEGRSPLHVVAGFCRIGARPRSATGRSPRGR